MEDTKGFDLKNHWDASKGCGWEGRGYANDNGFRLGDVDTLPRGVAEGGEAGEERGEGLM
jgi:hypothetical protein